MTNPFRKWLDASPKGTAIGLVRDGIVSSASIHKLRHGGVLRDYAKAKTLSEATGGVVSVQQLCETPQRRGRKT